MKKGFNDGSHSADIVGEIANGIVVPIIRDPDNYSGPAYTITVPAGSFGSKTESVMVFSEESGRLIEAWIKKHGADAKDKNLTFRLLDEGCIGIGVRRKR